LTIQISNLPITIIKLSNLHPTIFCKFLMLIVLHGIFYNNLVDISIEMALFHRNLYLYQTYSLKMEFLFDGLEVYIIYFDY
jgi:hypothetical protein